MTKVYSAILRGGKTLPERRPGLFLGFYPKLSFPPCPGKEGFKGKLRSWFPLSKH